MPADTAPGSTADAIGLPHHLTLLPYSDSRELAGQLSAHLLGVLVGVESCDQVQSVLTHSNVLSN